MKKQTAEGPKTSYLISKPSTRWVVCTILAFAGTYGFPFLCQIPGEALSFTNSFWSVAVFLILFGLLNQAILTIYKQRLDSTESSRRGRRIQRSWLWPMLAGVLFSLCMVFGSRLEMAESISFGNVSMWLAIVAEGIVFSILIRFAWEKLLQLQNTKATEAPEATEVPKASEVTGTKEQDKSTTKSKIPSWLITSGIIFLCYLPVFLAVFPGFFVYDAQDEYLQVVTRNFSTHHPLIHVLLLGGVIQLVFKLTGSYNAGIACYTILQMLIMSGIFGWTIKQLTQRGLSKAGRILLTLYFGVCPILVMFSLCSAKDGLFTGMLLMMVLLIQKLCQNPEAFFRYKAEPVLLCLSSFGMMLLRHNGFYAFLVFTPILLIYLRKYWKKITLLLGGTILVYFITNAGLAAILHADASENQEMLTVPIMQLARVYSYEKDSMTLEDCDMLQKFIPEEALNRYNPKVSDGVKIDFQNEYYESHKADFLNLWFRNGFQHPFAYLNAWCMTSYGFWYPDTIIDTYRGNTVFTYTYEDSSYFGYEVEQPGTRQSLIPWLNEVYRRLSLEISQQKLPVVSMLFSPGFLFWVTAFFLGFYCYGRKWNKLVPMLLPLLCFMTVLLGPACLVRYVVFWWALLPLVLIENKIQL